MHGGSTPHAFVPALLDRPPVAFVAFRCASLPPPSPMPHVPPSVEQGRKAPHKIKRVGGRRPPNGPKIALLASHQPPATPGSPKSLQPHLVRKIRAHARRFPPDGVHGAGAETRPEARTPGSKPARAAQTPCARQSAQLRRLRSTRDGYSFTVITMSRGV